MVKIDALRIVVETPTFEGKSGAMRERYASANDISSHGRYGGRKSEAYLELFRRVREAARTEMLATGWITWDGYVEVTVTRYHRTLVASDVGNLGKVEQDSLAPSTPKQERRDRIAPFSGVYENDKLVLPLHAYTEYDPDGPDRILIIVRRRYAYPPTVSARPRRVRGASSPAPPSTALPQPTPAYAPPVRGDDRPALLNGVPCSREEGLRLLGISSVAGRTTIRAPRRR